MWHGKRVVLSVLGHHQETNDRKIPLRGDTSLLDNKSPIDRLWHVFYAFPMTLSFFFPLSFSRSSDILQYTTDHKTSPLSQTSKGATKPNNINHDE